jgi:hypothetical protein
MNRLAASLTAVEKTPILVKKEEFVQQTRAYCVTTGGEFVWSHGRIGGRKSSKPQNIEKFIL